MTPRQADWNQSLDTPFNNGYEISHKGGYHISAPQDVGYALRGKSMGSQNLGRNRNIGDRHLPPISYTRQSCFQGSLTAVNYMSVYFVIQLLQSDIFYCLPLCIRRESESFDTERKRLWQFRR